MKKYLSYQKRLMQRAIQLQDEMTMYRNLFSTIDPVYCKAKVTECEEKYAEVMTTLTQHMCKITGFQIFPVPVDAQNNVVSICEHQLLEVR